MLFALLFRNQPSECLVLASAPVIHETLMDKSGNYSPPAPVFFKIIATMFSSAFDLITCWK